MNFDWTDEAVAELCKCAADKMSAGQTAVHLGERFEGYPSRNAIIGKALRLKLEWHNRPFGKSAGPSRRQRQKWNRNTGVSLPPTPIVTGDPAEIPEHQRKSILTLDNEHCRYPYGDPGQPDFFFCGAPEANCAGGIPYCFGHSRLAYQGAA